MQAERSITQAEGAGPGTATQTGSKENAPGSPSRHATDVRRLNS